MAGATRAVLLAALCVVLLSPPVHGALTPKAYLSAGQYTIRSKGRDGSCLVELLGFTDRKCSARGVGPVLLPHSPTEGFRVWTVQPVGPAHGSGRSAIISTFYPHGKTQPLCMGNLVAGKPAACHDSSVKVKSAKVAGADTPVKLVAVPGAKNTYYILLADRTAGCDAYLTASSVCSNATLTLAPLKKGSTANQQWVLEANQTTPSKPTANHVPLATPSPLPVPTSSPPAPKAVLNTTSPPLPVPSPSPAKTPLAPTPAPTPIPLPSLNQPPAAGAASVALSNGVGVFVNSTNTVRVVISPPTSVCFPSYYSIYYGLSSNNFSNLTVIHLPETVTFATISHLLPGEWYYVYVTGSGGTCDQGYVTPASAPIHIRMQCTTCKASEYQASPCPADNGDGVCETCTTCDLTTQYTATQCTAEADTECVVCTEVDNCAAYKSNTACRPDFQKTCLTCAATFFLNQTSGACLPCYLLGDQYHVDPNGNCVGCTDCADGYYEVQDCTQTTDRVCEPCGDGCTSCTGNSNNCDTCNWSDAYNNPSDNNKYNYYHHGENPHSGNLGVCTPCSSSPCGFGPYLNITYPLGQQFATWGAYQSAPCTETGDRVCTACSNPVCNTITAAAPTPDRRRRLFGSFPSPSPNPLLYPLLVPEWDLLQYRSSDCSTYADRVCSDCTTTDCGAGMYETKPCIAYDGGPVADIAYPGTQELYPPEADRVCASCDSGCSACLPITSGLDNYTAQFGPWQSNCSACEDGFWLNTTSGVGVCEACDEACGTCTGPEFSECLTCNFDAATATGYYFDETTSSCLPCGTAADCVSPPNLSYNVSGGFVYAECTPTSPLNCQPCYNNGVDPAPSTPGMCKTCAGSSYTDCTSCYGAATIGVHYALSGGTYFKPLGTTGHGECAGCTACPAHQYQTSPCTGTANRQCANCTSQANCVTEVSPPACITAPTTGSNYRQCSVCRAGYVAARGLCTKNTTADPSCQGVPAFCNAYGTNLCPACVSACVSNATLLQCTGVNCGLINNTADCTSVGGLTAYAQNLTQGSAEHPYFDYNCFSDKCDCAIGLGYPGFYNYTIQAECESLCNKVCDNCLYGIAQGFTDEDPRLAEEGLDYDACDYCPCAG